MTSGNYERIVEKISNISGIKKEEIEEKIKEKRSKLSGLISKEGAAQVIASELGVSFEDEILKLGELLPGMRNVKVLGKVLNISPVRSFKTKRGDESKVVNLWIADDSSNVRVVLWDTNHVALIEKGDIKDGTVIEIKNGSMRDNEIHLGNFSEINVSKETIEDIVTKKVFKEKEIVNFLKGESVSVRAFVVQAFEPKFFNVCPECKKKVEKEGDIFHCNTHGKVVPEKRAILTLVLDDGTESIRAVLFQEPLNKLGITDFEDLEKLSKQKGDLLGKEMIFSGNIKLNNFFNNLEIIVEDVNEVDMEETINKLEKSNS
ncbi:DUF2240 family protein [Patescibacteria group bacterium]|nr:DUF2240 family protein [Patescibacteria group bacterium]